LASWYLLESASERGKSVRRCARSVVNFSLSTFSAKNSMLRMSEDRKGFLEM
jgi:hypothetical protein